MKKLLAILLALAMVLTLVACGGNTDDDKDKPNKDDQSQGDKDKDKNEGDADADADDDADNKGDRLVATDVLAEIWSKFPEDLKPMTFGGETESEPIVENAPAAHAIGDGSKLFNDFGYPTEMIDKIEEAATLRHMMNVNTFTCGAYYVTDTADVKDICDGIEYALMNRNYLCGAPQQLVILTVHEHFVVSVFGAEDLVNAFKNAATEFYGDKVSVVYDQSMEGAHGEGGIGLGGIGVGF